MTFPLLGIVGYSGTGKTTLLKKLIPLLTQSGYHVALIKHTHHNVDLDTPGKDSYELRKSGAHQTLITCDQRWALMTETPQVPASLTQLAAQFHQPDLILVEGFKQEPIPKIALYRKSLGHTLHSLIDKNVIAIASDSPIDSDLPQLNLNDATQIANWIMAHYPRIER